MDSGKDLSTEIYKLGVTAQIQPMSNVFQMQDEEDTYLFTNRNALKIDYHPEEVVEREDEIESLVKALRSARHGDSPDNILIYGKTGVGKSVVTNHVVSDLQELVDITVVRVSCEPKSSYKTAINIVNELRLDTERDPLPKSGWSASDVFDELFKELNYRGKPSIVVLDEIDVLGSDDELLRKLPRAKDEGDLDDDTSLGVIGISNDFEFRSNLSPKVKDSLSEKEIYFSPYDATELQTILRQRAEVGISDGVVDEGVIKYCAAKGAQEHGSARKAIELLRESVEYAMDMGNTTVSTNDAEEARSRVEKNKIVDGVGSLPDHGILTLLALAWGNEMKERPIRNREIYELYEEFAMENIGDVLTRRAIRNQVDELVLHSLAYKNTVNQGQSGGRYNTYECPKDAQTISEAVASHRDDWETKISDTAQSTLGQ